MLCWHFLSLFMSKLADLTGKQFGRWLVIERAENNKRGATRWLCKCACGTSRVVYAFKLKNGTSSSCGCRLGRRPRNLTTSNRHGGSHTRLYRIWSAMNTRCYNPKHCKYKRYGGRGIAVCDDWRYSFIAFRDWALSHGYMDNLEIDRRDNDGHYSPENCRWVTRKENQNNRCDNIYISCPDNNTRTLTEVAELTGLPYQKLFKRKKENPQITYRKLTRQTKN